MSTRFWLAKTFFLMLKWRLFSILEIDLIIFMTCYAYEKCSTKWVEAFPHTHVSIWDIFWATQQENELFFFKFSTLRRSENPEYSIILLHVGMVSKWVTRIFKLAFDDFKFWEVILGGNPEDVMFLFFQFRSFIFENRVFWSYMKIL